MGKLYTLVIYGRSWHKADIGRSAPGCLLSGGMCCGTRRASAAGKPRLRASSLLRPPQEQHQRLGTYA